MKKKEFKAVSKSRKTAAAKELVSKTLSSAAATSPVKPSRKASKAPGNTTGTKKIVKKPAIDVTAEIAAVKPAVELSPAFIALAEPVLPELPRENRARLMMQTPTELFFYWSVGENPYQRLRKAFGNDIGNYVLVVKLTNLTTSAEEIHPAEADGSRWFDVEPDTEYMAEIGFYATNRPYFRIIFSNTIKTPRRAPSPRPSTDADWNLSADKFAKVLDVSGFAEDAFDVALSGDDHHAAVAATHAAFVSFIGTPRSELQGIAAEDIRYALTALAAGARLEDLRRRIGQKLFHILQANSEHLAPDKAMSALTENFGIDEPVFAERESGPAVFGASLVNFPRTLKPRGSMPKFAPVGSHSYR